MRGMRLSAAVQCIEHSAAPLWIYGLIAVPLFAFVDGALNGVFMGIACSLAVIIGLPALWRASAGGLWRLGIVLAIPCIAAALTARNGFSESLFGSAFEMGTLASFAVVACAFFAGTATSRSNRIALYGAVVLSVIACAGGLLLWWPDAIFTTARYGLAAYAGTALSLAALASLSARAYVRTGLLLLLLVPYAALLAQAPPSITVPLSLATLAALFIRRMPLSRWHIVLAGFIAILMLSGIARWAGVLPAVAMQMPEQPSLGMTLYAAVGTYTYDPLAPFIGTGGNSFARVWALQRPLEANEYPLWNTDFSYASSLLVTVALTYGLPAALAFLLSIVFAGVKIGETVREGGVVSLLAILIASYWALFAAPDIGVLALCAFTAGAYAIGASGTEAERAAPRAARAAVCTGIAAMSLVVCICAAARLPASMAYEQAMREVNFGALEDGEQSLRLSIERKPSSRAMMALSALLQNDARALQQTLASGGMAADRARLDQLVTEARQLAVPVEWDYRSLINRGDALTLEYLVHRNDAAKSDALAAYRNAYAKGLRQPLTAFALGRYYAVIGDAREARVWLRTALELKPDFQEAKTLLNRLGG